MEESIKDKANRSRRILVAEDDKINQRLFFYLLKDVADELIFADDGAEAFRKYTEGGDFGLVLMDIKMPVMDGYEATRKILDHDPAAKVVALSAYAFEHEQNKAIAEGFIDYITKPVQRERLLDAVEKYLQ
ncbi:response regulator [Maribellus sp. YY47]|uniref:response regulator n=1 Tax=Maribellus sp. YY47 TaxID=2929486 RepID=UPI002001D8A1|nr:response regulator [Maribellus sp. YY47]MCK3683891.1 response regulator [Maribellus sp. YY47]